MKRIIYILGFVYLAVSCQNLTKGEQAVLNYMREQTGFQDLDIEFSEVHRTEHTVKDSINILQQLYEKESQEKEDKIEKFEKDVEKYTENLKGVDKKSMEYQFLGQFLSRAQKSLEMWKKKEIANRKYIYEGRDVNEVLAVLLECDMTSLINPALKAKQTKTGVFLLSPDEKKCIRQLK